MLVRSGIHALSHPQCPMQPRMVCRVISTTGKGLAHTVKQKNIITDEYFGPRYNMRIDPKLFMIYLCIVTRQGNQLIGIYLNYTTDRKLNSTE